MTLNLDTIDGAVTDWTGTEEIWVLMDVSAYSTQSVRFSFFFPQQLYLVDIRRGRMGVSIQYRYGAMAAG